MLKTIHQILNLFERRERLVLVALWTLMIIAALVQTAGVASIMPFMSLVASPDMISSNEWMRWLYDSMGFESTRAFLVFTGVAVLGIMAFSNTVTGFEQWLMFRFIWRTQHRLAVRLLDQYLHEPFTFYLNQNSSNLATNILSEITHVINGVLTPVMRILAQSLVIIFIFGLLLLVDSTVALTAAVVLGGAYSLIFLLVRRKQTRLGKTRRAANSRRFKSATEALGSIKETKVLGTEGEFLRRFSVSDRRYSDTSSSNAIVSDIPKYALETLAFGGILVIVLYLLHTREHFGEAVAVVSLYALAGYRLMPALQQVFRGLARIRFFLPALDGVHADLMNRGPRSGSHQTPVDGSIPFERDIVLDGIVYRYPGETQDVIKKTNLQIRKNTSVAFVGTTGCGKTTLIDVLLGLLEPRHGSISVDGTALTSASIPAWRRRLGYVPQHIYLSDDTITRNIAFGIPDARIDPAAVERAARTAHLHEYIVSLTAGYDTVVGERGVRLSGGQRQRIGIARALYRDPDVLIMDEATSALDGITEDAVIQAIRDLARKKTIVLVAHRLTTVRDCDAIYVFDRGEIVASGTYHDLMQTNHTFRAMAKGAVEEPIAT